MKKRILIPAVCVFIVGGLVTGLWAAKAVRTQQEQQNTSEVDNTTSGGRLSLQEIVTQSNKIVIGKAVGSRVQWVDRNLYTLFTIEVSETLKGGNESTITVAIPGGIDVNRKIPLAMTVPGAPAIQQNEDVFLFLSPDEAVSSTAFSVTGFDQGKFSIVEDANGGRIVAGDMSISRGKGMRTLRAQSGEDHLSEFKSRVKSYIK